MHPTRTAIIAAVTIAVTGCTQQTTTPAMTETPIARPSASSTPPPQPTPTVGRSGSGVEDGPTGAPPTLPTMASSDPRTARPSGKAGIPRGQQQDPEQTPRQDAQVVANAFVATVMTWDSALDQSRNDAGIRAAVLATPTLAAALSSARVLAGPDQDWTDMVTHAGWSTTTAARADRGPDRGDAPLSVKRAVTATTVLTGTDGWSKSTTPATFVLTLTRDTPSAGWAVAEWRPL